MWSWMQRAAKAVRLAVRQQRLALAVALGALRAPLVGQAQPVSLGAVARWEGVSLQQALQHPAVRLALKWREAKLLRLAQEAQQAQAALGNRAQRRRFLRSSR
jgi:hypothetical protein